MENSIFCYQCEQTVGGKGCTKSGVCGKAPEIANMQNLLIYQLKGIFYYTKPLIENGKVIDKEIVKFVVGWNGIKDSCVSEDGTKDFSEIIDNALELGGFKEDEEVKEILVVFDHHATLSHAEAIVSIVK